MYAALSLQLGGIPDVQQLRQQTADYLLVHEADFLPFLTDLQTGDALESDAFGQYCHSVATTHTWGGQPEVRRPCFPHSPLHKVIRKENDIHKTSKMRDEMCHSVD